MPHSNYTANVTRDMKGIWVLVKEITIILSGKYTAKITNYSSCSVSKNEGMKLTGYLNLLDVPP